jgi:hypothetical protein
MTRAVGIFDVVLEHPAMCHARPVETGERMFVWCDGGPAVGRAVQFPPPLEIEVDRGIYVLVDDGPPEHRRYECVPMAH